MVTSTLIQIYLKTNALLPIRTDAVAMAAALKSQFSIISLCSCCQTIAHILIEGLSTVAQELLFGSVSRKQLWPSIKWLFSTCGDVSDNIFATFWVLLKHKISDHRDIQTLVLIPLSCTILLAKEIYLFVFWHFQMVVAIHQKAMMCALFSIYSH